jgi:hypothetical protein
MFDVFFISYHEQYADENFEALLDIAPLAKRVDGVAGIFNAHKRAAELSKTKMFYVIDADAILVDEFKFDYLPTELDEVYKGTPATKCIHTWRAINPINDLVYGYGGIKLFPTKGLKNATKWNVDFTTSVIKHFIPMSQVSNITAFNTDPYSTWKSAFRECTKLASSIIRKQHEDTEKRLDVWCTVGKDNPYGEYAIAGANIGREYGTKYKDNIEALSKINDYEWLKEQYERNYN